MSGRTIFEFQLPKANMSNNAKHDAGFPESMGLEASRSFVRGKRFVVLEDDLMVSEALVSALELLGGKVECFDNAKSALQHPDIENADCYIVDYILSGEMDGINFLLGLRQKLRKPICAVMMSGNTSSYFVRKAEMFDWPVIQKPANIEKLISWLSGQYGRSA